VQRATRSKGNSLFLPTRKILGLETRFFRKADDLQHFANTTMYVGTVSAL
jgi:hypothetical protein